MERVSKQLVKNLSAEKQMLYRFSSKEQLQIVSLFYSSRQIMILK